MVKKHPDVKIKGATVDMSDLEQDPIVMFQKKYGPVLYIYVHAKLISLIKSLQILFSDDAPVLLRPANYNPLLRVEREYMGVLLRCCSF